MPLPKKNPFAYEHLGSTTIGFWVPNKAEPLWWTGSGFKDLSRVRGEPEEFPSVAAAEHKIKTEILSFIADWRGDQVDLVSGWGSVPAGRTAAEDLLPIMHPLYNLREICKQCALLEDHLNNERKRCQDCIRKHLLTIEALFEEATSLDNKAKWSDKINGKADLVREIQARWIDGEDPRVLAQDLRAIRKDFAPECFDLREMTEESRMASQLRFSMASQVAFRVLGRGRHVCGAVNPVHVLRDFLADLNGKAMGGEDIATPGAHTTLANLLQSVDEALTGHPKTGRPMYREYAKKVLEFEPVVVHLADDGYSRLVVSILEEPYLRLDAHSSLPGVVENWKLLKG